LRPRHQLMPEIMMTFDIPVPQHRVRFGEHRIDVELSCCGPRT
jgi:hypothetical protein